MIQAIADTTFSLAGTTVVAAFVIPYVMGWEAVRGAIARKLTPRVVKVKRSLKRDFVAAVSQLDARFAEKHGRVNE